MALESPTQPALSVRRLLIALEWPESFLETQAKHLGQSVPSDILVEQSALLGTSQEWKRAAGTCCRKLAAQELAGTRHTTVAQQHSQQAAGMCCMIAFAVPSVVTQFLLNRMKRFALVPLALQRKLLVSAGSWSKHQAAHCTMLTFGYTLVPLS